MSDLTGTALELMTDRAHFHPAYGNAASTNGLVSVKLHRIREQLETKLAASLKAFDETQRRFAKQHEGAPISCPGLIAIPSLTPAYEADPEQAEALAAALAPILTEPITISVPRLTAADAGWITADKDIGATLARYCDGIE